jgi:hypothetical protein
MGVHAYINMYAIEDYVPREILYCEIAKYAGSAGRRMLALTCKDFLRELPKVCPRKIATAKASKYKLIAENPRFDAMLIGGNNMMFASARLGRFPAIHTQTNTRIPYFADASDWELFVKIAYRRGSRNLLHYARTRSNSGCMFWPNLAISRGHYWVLEEMVTYTGVINDEDFKYLDAQVLDYELAHAPHLLQHLEAVAQVASTMTLVKLLAVETATGISLASALTPAARAQKWDIFDHIMTQGVTSPRDVIAAGLAGGYDRLVEHYPQRVSSDYSRWIDYPTYHNASPEIKERLFRASCVANGFTLTLAMLNRVSQIGCSVWIAEYVRETPGCVLPQRLGNIAALHLLKAGALPSPGSEFQMRLHAEIRAKRGETMNHAGVIALLGGSPPAATLAQAVSILKSLDTAEVAPTTAEKTAIIKVAYNADSLELLHAVTGGSLKYNHSSGRALPADSKIRAWRVTHNLPCGPPPKR